MPDDSVRTAQFIQRLKSLRASLQAASPLDEYRSLPGRLYDLRKDASREGMVDFARFVDDLKFHAQNNLYPIRIHTFNPDTEEGREIVKKVQYGVCNLLDEAIREAEKRWSPAAQTAGERIPGRQEAGFRPFAGDRPAPPPSETESLRRQLDDERRTREFHEQRVRRAEEEKRAQVETLNAEIGGLQAENRALQRTVEELTREKRQQEALRDPQFIPNALRTRLAGLPSSLQEIVTDLLAAVDSIRREDRESLTQNIDRIDRSIYTSAETAARLAQVGFRDHDLLHQIDILRLWADERLRELGIETICPIPKQDRFDRALHTCLERDLVWNNREPALHNFIHSVLKVGYRDVTTNSVLRKAEVKKYLFMDGKPEGLDDLPVQEDAPEVEKESSGESVADEPAVPVSLPSPEPPAPEENPPSPAAQAVSIERGAEEESAPSPPAEEEFIDLDAAANPRGRDKKT